jgi:hypothetical protein
VANKRSVLVAVFCAMAFSSLASFAGSLTGPCTNLTPVGAGELIWDPTNAVYWLADANLGKSNPYHVAGVYPDGTMDYTTALSFVGALNQHKHFGLSNWQLPTTPAHDSSCATNGPCTGHHSFGPGCTANALGALYSTQLSRTYPMGLVADKQSFGPFHNLQPSLYWTSVSRGSSGQVTFSFTLGSTAANTPAYNYFHVLAIARGALPDAPTSGTGLVAYSNKLAVYDFTAQPPVTWLLDANLAATDKLGLKGTTTVAGTAPGSKTLTVPEIASNGTMTLNIANTWIGKLNSTHWAGAGTTVGGKTYPIWMMPSDTDLSTLFNHLQLTVGDPRLLMSGTDVSPFKNFQPFFYWSCMRDPGTNQLPCNGQNAGTLHCKSGGTPMEWAFNFDSGFLGTDENTKKFFFIAYSPGNEPPQCAPGKCSTPQQCCLQAGGYWNGHQCQ